MDVDVTNIIWTVVGSFIGLVILLAILLIPIGFIYSCVTLFLSKDKRDKFKRNWFSDSLRYLVWGFASLVTVYIFGPHDTIDSYVFRSSVIEQTLKSGQLAPFPKGMTHLAIHEYTSWFHAGCNGSFSAEPAQIDDWLKNSPGFHDYEKKSQSDGSIEYTKIKGETYDSIIVSSDRAHVSFRIEWL